jgi:hypothetical protein
MILQTRQLVSTDEIETIELNCRKHGCGGILRIDLRPGGLNSEEQCPRCKRTWWTPDQPNTARELLEALTNSRHMQNEGPDGPTVTMILPGPADGAM